MEDQSPQRDVQAFNSFDQTTFSKKPALVVVDQDRMEGSSYHSENLTQQEEPLDVDKGLFGEAEVKREEPACHHGSVSTAQFNDHHQRPISMDLDGMQIDFGQNTY